MVTWRDDPVTVGTRSFGYRRPYSPGHTPIPSANGNVKRRTADGWTIDEFANTADDPTTAGPPPPTSGLFPNRNDGKPITQLGLTGNDYYNAARPYLNDIAKNVFTNMRISRPGDTAASAFEIVQSGVLDPETLLPSALSGNGVQFFDAGIGVVLFGAIYVPDDFAPADYHLDFPSGWTVDLQNQTSMTLISSTDTRKVYRRSAGATGFPGAVRVTAIAANGAAASQPNAIKFYEASKEALVAAGTWFDQRHVDYAKRYKITRFMDWQNTNFNWARTIDQIATRKTIYRGAKAARAWSRYTNYHVFGIPLEDCFEFARLSDTAAWVHCPLFIGAPSSVCDIFDSFSGDPNVPDYDPVKLENLRLYAVANAAAILNSNEWRRYCDAVVAAMIAQNYPLNYALIYALGNEPWNTGFYTNFVYLQGLGEALVGPGAGAMAGYGYMVANLMVHMDAALAAAGRPTQNFRMMLECQNATPSSLSGAHQGFDKYFADRSIDAAPYRARTGASAASYLDGAFSRDNGVVSPYPDAAAWQVAISARIQADPALLRRQFRDWLINSPSTVDGSVAYLRLRRSQVKAIAEAWGQIYFCDYEAGIHTIPYGFVDDPIIGRWTTEWSTSTEAAQALTALYDGLLQDDQNIGITDFVDVGFGVRRFVEGSRAWEAPWLNPYYGDAGGQWDAMQPYLRPAP